MYPEVRPKADGRVGIGPERSRKGESAQVIGAQNADPALPAYSIPAVLSLATDTRPIVVIRASVCACAGTAMAKGPESTR